LLYLATVRAKVIASYLVVSEIRTWLVYILSVLLTKRSPASDPAFSEMP